MDWSVHCSILQNRSKFLKSVAFTLVYNVESDNKERMWDCVTPTDSCCLRLDSGAPRARANSSKTRRSWPCVLSGQTFKTGTPTSLRADKHVRSVRSMSTTSLWGPCRMTDCGLAARQPYTYQEHSHPTITKFPFSF